MPLIDCDLKQRILKELDMSMSNEDATVMLRIDSTFPITPKLREAFHLSAKELKETYGTDLVSEKSFMKKLKKHIKGSEDLLKARHIFYMQFLLYNNHDLLSVFEDLVNSEALKTPDSKDIAVMSNAGLGKDIPLDSLPLGSIKVLLSYVSNMVAPLKKDSFEGFFGTLRMTLMPQRYLRMHDVTGALSIGVKASESYFKDIQTHVESFVGPDILNLGGKNRKYGSNQIYTKLYNDVILSLNIENIKENREKIAAMFYMLNMDWMFIEDGKMMINSDYDIIYEKDEAGKETKKEKRYKDTKGIIRSFKNPMTIEDYIKGKGLGKDKVSLKALEAGKPINEKVLYRLTAKERYIKVDKKTAAIFENSVKEMQGLLSHFADFYDKENPKADTEIMKAVSLFFKKTTTKGLRKAIYSNKFDDVHPDEVTDLEFIIDLFSNVITSTPVSLFGPFSTKSNEIRRKDKNYAPANYPDERFITYQISKVINKVKAHIVNLKGGRKVLDEATEKKVEKYEEVVEYFTNVIRRKTSEDFQELDEYGMGGANTPVYLKGITGWFDLRDASVDPGEFGTYFKKSITVLMRKHLTAQFLSGINKARKSGNKVVEDYLINNYKQVFNRPDVKSGIPGIVNTGFQEWWGGNFKDRAISTLMSLFPLVPAKIMQISGMGQKRVQRYLSRWQKIPTATMLYSPLDGATNMIAQLYKRNHFTGTEWEQYLGKDGYAGLDKERKEVVDSLVKISGILSFNDFFVEALIAEYERNGLHFSLEDNLFIVQEVIKSYERLEKGHHPPTVYKDLHKEIGTNAQILAAIDKSIAKDIRKELRIRKKERGVTRAVNSAIARIFHDIKLSSSKYRRTALQRLKEYFHFGKWKTVEKIFTGFPFFKDYSMGKTEEDIRSSTAQFALMKYRDMGKFSSKDILKWTDADKRLARDLIGEAVATFDYLMSPTDLGYFFKGLVGSLHGKFKGWAIQHLYATEKRILDEMIEEVKNQINDSYKWYGKPLKILEGVLMGLNAMKDAISKKKSWRQFQKENPHLEKFLTYYAWTGAFSLILALEPHLHLIYWLGKRMGTKYGYAGVGALSNMHINFFVILPILLLSMAANGWEDDELEDFFLYKLRHIPGLGYYAGMSSTMIMGIWGLLSNDRSSKIKAKKQLKSAVPFYNITEDTYNLVEDALK